jgi:serine racemase
MMIVCLNIESLFIHPSENLNVISGQGTIAIEILQQVSDLDAIIVPVGGGGLISGIATAAKAIKGDILIIGAEPSNADDALRSKEAKQLIKNTTTPTTIADGLRTSLGANTWPVVRDLVDDVMAVSEDEIKTALYLVWQRMKVMIEPSAAVSVAVAISAAFGNKYPSIKKVGVILCGGKSQTVPCT